MSLRALASLALAAVSAAAAQEKLLAQPMQVVNRTAAVDYLAEKRGDGHAIAVITNTWITERRLAVLPDVPPVREQGIAR